MYLNRKLQCAMTLKGQNLSAKSQYGSQFFINTYKK